MIKHLGPLGINIPTGFATTAHAFREFLKENSLNEKIKNKLDGLDTIHYHNLNVVSNDIKSYILNGKLSDALCSEIEKHYKLLCDKYNREVDVAVRSSATAEDLPTASFAGQHDSFLNIRGIDELKKTVLKCYASLFNARAIKYRNDHGFEHEKVALSAGIQLMVRSDLSSSGVCFSIEPDSGFENSVVITGCWGLGENIVQGTVTPDEFHVFKPFIGKTNNPVISKKLGSKLVTMVYKEDGSGIINIPTKPEMQERYTLSQSEIITLASWAKIIEDHYKMPMDIEWAKDGYTNELMIVQARPETVHGQKETLTLTDYKLIHHGKTLCEGNAVGSGIKTGIARVLDNPSESHKLQAGEILVTNLTNPDWDPILKKAAAIITNKGGRTSHAAIVARELGAIAIVGADGATDIIQDGQLISVDNSQGKTGYIYEGEAQWESIPHNFSSLVMPKTKAMLILADPDKAYKYSFYPNEGVGLLRLEFIINNSIRVHPMALAHFDSVQDQHTKAEIEKITHGYSNKKEFFIDKLSQAISTIAAAFYPKDVIVRMSDFKSNEYSDLIGGKIFEPTEENPMIGFRGASRYYHESYKDGFLLECETMKKVRDEMGFLNVKLMIPFCRTVEEGKKVLDTMEKSRIEER
jgi:pyruvate, water dikinase